jgi:hypothetical protein
VSDGNLTFFDQKVRYLDFTRQVFVAGEDEQAEFDDLAVQMCITLGFETADGSESISNLWIPTPNDLESALATFRRVPFVQSYIAVPAQHITITIDRCG